MSVRDIPNALTILRLCLVGVLWVLALLHWPVAFVICLAVAWFTDAIDGVIARTYHVESKQGAVLDSVADNSIQISQPFWLWLLRPEIYTHYWHLIAILLVLFVGGMILQWLRRAPMHTWANKVTAWLVAAFLLYTYAFGLCVWFMWVTFVGLVYAMGEAILILLFKDDVSEDTKSLWT
ncbi:MAG: CDP-alcohol phosphatidyltransferase family protein [Armatimonadetes bacterium]|nr:CDP-alcohol phosphatidyltransferase family protein [Armatimonadota bacterium]